MANTDGVARVTVNLPRNMTEASRRAKASNGRPATTGLAHTSALDLGMEAYYENEWVTIYHADCRDLLPDMEGRFDLVLTDPPYGIGKKWASKAMVGRNGSSRLWGNGEKWDDNTPDSATIKAAVEAGSFSILWGGNYFGLPPSRGWLVWDKVQRFTGADAELAWTNLKLPVRIFRMSRIDAYFNQAEYKKEHPTEKPMQLMRWCLSHVPQARSVLDPFMGSGTSLIAAAELGHKAVGVELEERYCEIAARRLETVAERLRAAA